MKLLLITLFLIPLVSCGDIEDPTPQNTYIPTTYLRARWNIEKLKEAPLEIYLSEQLIDLLPIEGENKVGLNLIEQMAELWNLGHPDLDFFGLPFIRSENKVYTNLNDFLDDEIGIYPSYGWYKSLSKRSLGITQFFGKRINLANGKQYIELVHADIIINFKDHEYSIDEENSDKFDLITIIFHEMGHMIGLPHPRGKDAWGVMAATLGRDDRKRKLSAPDLDGLFKAYPLEETKYLYDIPDFNAPLYLYIDPPLERFIIELMEDGHKHFHHNGKYISCEKNIH